MRRLSFNTGIAAGPLSSCVTASMPVCLGFPVTCVSCSDYCTISFINEVGNTNN